MACVSVVALVVPLVLLALLVLMERLERVLTGTLTPPGGSTGVEDAARDGVAHPSARRAAPVSPTGVARRPTGASPRQDTTRLGVVTAVSVLVVFAAVDIVTSGGRLGSLTDVGIVASSVTFAATVRPRRLAWLFLPSAALLVAAVAAGLWRPGPAHVPFRVWRAVVGDDVSDASASLLVATLSIAVAVAVRRSGRLRVPLRHSSG